MVSIVFIRFISHSQEEIVYLSMPNIQKENVFINNSFLSTRYSNDDRPKSIKKITKLKYIIRVYSAKDFLEKCAKV